MKVWIKSPQREYVLIPALIAILAAEALYPRLSPLLFGVAAIASLPVAHSALRAAFSRRITIDTFNVFALAISFASSDARSAAFVTLMLCFASLLEARTAARSSRALKKMLELKPEKALVQKGGGFEEIKAHEVKTGDIIIAESGSRIPVDGEVVFGNTYVNESPITGESVPVMKTVGDFAYSGSLVESGVLKIKATHVGKDSTIERMAGLMKEAMANKSGPERLADRFAAVFLPVVGLAGLAAYVFTRDLSVVASVFLVACADDMAVAIPLAVTAALGGAARLGILMKGGERVEALSKLDTIVLDKTGTVTYGNLEVEKTELAKGVPENRFWKEVASAEKFAEHPAGKAIYRFASLKTGSVPDPLKFESVAGGGVCAELDGSRIIIGNPGFLASRGIACPPLPEDGGGWAWIAKNGTYAGRVRVRDMPRPEAGAALWKLRQMGVKRIVMFTGDRPDAAARIAAALGIDEYRAGMSPEDKVRELEKISRGHRTAMVGDGVNDAPVLARADIGIAMGGGTQAAIEAADIVIMNDRLSRIPAALEIARHAMRVIRWDIAVWAISNAAGFALVFSGLIGPAAAAAYNLLTDFFPLLNSARLFRILKKHEEQTP